MSIKSIANRINDYKRIYLEAQRKISALRDSNDLTENGKSVRISETINRYAPQVERSAERVLEEIESTQGELRSDRQKAIKAGMEKADQIEIVKKGISSGDYDKEYIEDLIEIYKDNPPAIEAIRSAVKGSDKADIVALASQIPEDMTSKRIKALEKAKEKIETAPKLGDSWHRDDWSTALWANGTSIESLVTYLLGLEDVEQVTQPANDMFSNGLF